MTSEKPDFRQPLQNSINSRHILYPGIGTCDCPRLYELCALLLSLLHDLSHNVEKAHRGDESPDIQFREREMDMLKRRGGFTLIEIMIVILIIAVLLAIAIPNFLRARETSRARTCQANLRMIETAKEQWAMDYRKTATDTPPASELVNNYIKGTGGVLPACPADGTYTIGNVSTRPSCSIGTNSTPSDTDDHIYLQSGG
jgi:prepilin-type N-terminal cleavage/methylation domain-containing protein